MTSDQNQLSKAAIFGRFCVFHLAKSVLLLAAIWSTFDAASGSNLPLSAAIAVASVSGFVAVWILNRRWLRSLPRPLP
jgi:hypothetical protein